MKHIIIEGPDGAGKTMLARRLCRTKTMSYHHEGPPPANVSALHHYAGLLVNARRPTVFDRFHLGETIYGSLLRGRSALFEADLKLMDRLLFGLGITTIICLPNLDTCLANSRRKKELIKDERVREAAWFAWQALAQKLGPERIQLFDYRENPRCRFNVAQRAACPEGVIGSVTASMLLVGERSNSRVLDLPFFGTTRSSGYLNGCLAEAGLPESALAFTNALDLKGWAHDLTSIIDQMPTLRIVAPLGRVAKNQLERRSTPKFVNILPIPHPQYWKRFHAKSRNVYISMLRNAYHAAA